MTNYLSPTRLFSPPFGSPFNPPSSPLDNSPFSRASPSYSHISTSYEVPESNAWHYRPPPSPFSSPSKSQSKAPIISSPYRAPYESDSDDETEDNSNTNNTHSTLQESFSAPTTTETTSTRGTHVRLPPKSPNRFEAPEIESDEEEDDGPALDPSVFSEASLNMHGSFLPNERYEDFEASAASHKLERGLPGYADHEIDQELDNSRPTSAISPFHFSFSIYDNYLKSPLRSPLRSPSQWDDNDYSGYERTVPPSPSHLVSPELHYLLDDLTISPKRNLPERSPIPTTPPAPTPAPPRTMVTSYQAMSRAIQQESALELRHALDDSAATAESLKLSRKAQTYRDQAKLREEEAKKDAAYQKTLTNIANQKAYIEKQIRDRQEQDKLEQLRKQEAERKRLEDERLAIERKRIEEEQKRKLEAERKQREEAERKQREEEARIKEEERRREEERKQKEELEKKIAEDERKQREEEERKRIEQENEKKRLEDERKTSEEEQAKKEEAKRREEEVNKSSEANVAPPSVSPGEYTSQPSVPPVLPTDPAAAPALTEAQLEEKKKKKETKKYISPGATEEFLSHSRHYKSVVQKIQELDTNPSFKDTKRRVTMDINVKIGQLCPDRAIINERTSELLHLCQEAAGQGEPVQLFCLNLLSVKIMRQTALVEKPQSVFPVAVVAMSLMQKIPALEKILIAKFYEYCPYTVPRYPRRKPGQSDLDYKKSMGYSQIEDSPPKLEEDPAFYSRMEGAVRLYAAIIQTPCGNGQHPYGLAHGWTWLARLANLPPTDITASVLRVFLEIAGHELLKAYRMQFHKLLVYFAHDFVPKCPPTRPSDHDRLVKYLDSYLRTGTLSPPQGRDFT